MSESFRFYYLRVSGLLMVALVLIHLFIMHYASAPSATTAAFVAGRWAGAGWRAFDWALLLLALTHGIAGVQGMLREAVRRPAARAAIDAAAVAVAAGFAALGTAAVLAGRTGGEGALGGAVWIPGVLIGGLVLAATAAYAAAAAAAAVIVWHLAGREPIGRWNYSGQWAFALNRAAGAGLLAFLLVHVIDVALFPFAPVLYDRTLAAYAMPYLVPMEAALVAAVVYHALDGLRLMLMEVLDRRGDAIGAPSFLVLLLLTASLSAPAVVVLLARR
jgi:succinate dehydrogenase / fumarate reductase membrane anchor subunit